MDMIERLAVAIQKAAKEGNDSPVDRGDAEGLARAVLKAMREPTPLLVLDGSLATDGEVNAGIVNTIWQAMIDTALAGEGKGE